MTTRKAAKAAPQTPTPPLTVAHTTAAPDPEAARHAFDSLKPRFLAIPQVKTTRPGLDQAALFVLARVKDIADEKLRPRFARLPHDVFDIALLDELGPLAQAAWYAQVQLDSAMAATSEVRVPLSTVEAATSVKTRMLQVADYHLAHRNAALAAEIADIRTGTGYADLASDLSRLKALYQQHLEPLHPSLDDFARLDPHYQRADAAEAGRLSGEILDEMTKGRTREQQAAQNLASRAWTLLTTTWERVSAASALVLDEATTTRLFQSLYAAARAPRSPRKKSAPTTSPADAPSPTKNG